MRLSLPLERLPSLAAGLSETEATERRARYGPNAILETPPGGWRDILRDTGRDPMLWFLLVASSLFAAIGDLGEAATLLVAILPLIGMDVYLHRRTQASTQGLRSRLAERATVIRDGAAQDLPATAVVCGDLVEVAAGDAFPADGIVIAGEGLQADEATLTGEAFPVPKAVLRLPTARQGATAVEGAHWGFAGTRLLTGTARLCVIYTGGDTLYGQIVRSARQGAHARTPLQTAIANLVSILLVAAAILCVMLAIVRLQQGHGLADALLSAVTLAVAAIPEEFPVVFTFFLGVGAFRLARRQALVRRAVVVENIGRVTAICSDKTGTLTEGRLRVAHILPAAGLGSEQTLAIAAAASRREGGDPLDAALLDAAGANASDAPRVATFPFTEDRRRETAIIRIAPGRLRAVTKGAPETILALCPSVAAATDWRRQVDELAASSHKVIACAMRDMDETAWPGGEPDRGYLFAGLIACEDPVREGVREAVGHCAAAGIKVLMVTGDHPLTAGAVAGEIGIGGAAPVVIESDEATARLAGGDSAFLATVDVVARAVPAQKLSLVQAFQTGGHIVAVTGDGVNDVPALKAADIGIAMGERGTRSAREVAAIVLLDDNFRTIVRAIAEGRQLFANLRRSFAYLLMIHAPLVISAALIPLSGHPLLYLPVHIVWLELIIHPTALLVFQDLPAEAGLARARRSSRSRFFDLRSWTIIGLAGGAITLAVVLGYERSLSVGVEHARAMALVALIIASAAITAGLGRLRTWAGRIVPLAAVASAVLLIQAPALARLVHVAPLHLDDWGLASVGGLFAGVIASWLKPNGVSPRNA